MWFQVWKFCHIAHNNDIRTSFFWPSVFTARKRSLGQGNIFTPVCHSVHGGGLSQCMLGCHPPPRADTPPPLAADTPRQQTPPRADTPREQTPPPPSRACWEIWSMSGRYTSYWNAILLFKGLAAKRRCLPKNNELTNFIYYTKL